MRESQADQHELDCKCYGGPHGGHTCEACR